MNSDLKIYFYQDVGSGVLDQVLDLYIEPALNIRFYSILRSKLPGCYGISGTEYGTYR